MVLPAATKISGMMFYHGGWDIPKGAPCGKPSPVRMEFEVASKMIDHPLLKAGSFYWLSKAENPWASHGAAGLKADVLELGVAFRSLHFNGMRFKKKPK